MIKKFFSNKLNILVLIIMVLVIITRFVNLGWPDWQVFDEIYYNNFARGYLNGNYIFDVHPPLGKLFILLGELVFPNSVIGWRVTQAIIGSAVVFLIYQLAKILFKNRLISIIALILAASSTMLLVESRLSLLNIFIIFFQLISYAYFWYWVSKGKPSDFYLALIFLSLACSVKWTAAFGLLAFLFFIIIDSKTREQFTTQINVKFIAISIISLALPYLIIFSINLFQGDKLVKWHLEAMTFHLNLKGDHPYASAWWQWFIDARPIWLDFHLDNKGNVFGIVEIGNPIILWLGIIAFLCNWTLCLAKKNKALFFVLFIIVINTIPWIFIKRESFFYHFLPILPLLIISLAYWLNFLWKELKLKYLVMILLVLVIAFFIWYWPMITGTKIPYQGYNERISIDSWR